MNDNKMNSYSYYNKRSELDKKLIEGLITRKEYEEKIEQLSNEYSGGKL